MLCNVIRLEVTRKFFVEIRINFLDFRNFWLAEIVLEGSLKIYTLGNEPSFNIDQTKNYKCFDSLEKADYVSIFLSEKTRFAKFRVDRVLQTHSKNFQIATKITTN